MPHARQSEFPEAVPLRPKALGRTSGTHVLPPMPLRKPALARRNPDRLRKEIQMAHVLGFTMRTFEHEDGRIGVSNVELARWCGVSESIVRCWKVREKAVTPYNLMQMPADFRESLLSAWDQLFGSGGCANDNDLG